MGRRIISVNPDIIWISALGIVTLLLAVMLARQTPVMIAVIPLALIVASMILTNDGLCLATAILVLPLSASIPLSFYLLPTPGFKINNILLFLLLIGFLLNRKLNLSGMKLAAFFYIGSLLLLIIAIIRADHVASFALYLWNESYEPVKFFLSRGLIPLLTSIPFLMIIGRIRTHEEIHRVAYYLALSMSLFAIVIIGIYFIKVPSGSDFSTVRNVIGLENLGMHGNNLADFIIVGFPLMFSMALLPAGRYQKWFYQAAILSLLAATLIYSRTAYATILLSIPVIMFLTRRYRLTIPFLALLIIVIIIVPGVMERAVTGLENGEYDVITAGRTDEIWRPVLKEWQEQVKTAPLKVVFGHGRYGILDLQTFKNQRMFYTTHPHNMYLDTLMDTGLVGLFFYLAVIGFVTVRLIQTLYRRIIRGRNEEIHLTAGLLVAIFCFLIRGTTDSFLLPHLTNSYFYIIMALAFVVLWQEKVTQELEGGK